MEEKAYRLIEMEDSMKEAIEKAKDVQKEQKELIEVVEKSDKAEKFKNLIEELNGQVKDLENQISTMEKRIDALHLVNQSADKNTIENLITALGLFDD